MNEPNHWESQLRSWTPRRPSAKIRKTLFAAKISSATAPQHRFSWNWLAPTAICAFTLLMMLGARPHSPTRFGETDTNLFFASISMHDVTSFQSGNSLKSAFNLNKVDLNLEQNVWRSASFESTNLPQSSSSSRSLPVETTNSLTR